MYYSSKNFLTKICVHNEFLVNHYIYDVMHFNTKFIIIMIIIIKHVLITIYT